MMKTLVTIAAPCSCLDVEKFQSWLEDLSAQGYLLVKPRLLRNSYQFHRIAPLKTRYRLTPLSDALEDWNERPDAENAALAQTFGWEYVCTVGGFHIYRSYSGEDRELNTDPRIMADSLRILRKRALLTALAVLISPLLYLLVVAALVGPGHIWQHLVRNGIVLYISFALLYLFTTFNGITRSVKLWKLYHLLNSGKLPVRYQDWRPSEKGFRLRSAAAYAVCLVLILAISLFRTAGQDQLRLQEHPEPGSSLPFPTILDLAEASNCTSADRLEAGGMIHWTNPFSPGNYEWTEIVDVVSEDGRTGRFSMELSYYEIHSGWLADRLTEELVREATSTGTPLESGPAPDTDLLYSYTDHRGCPSAVIRLDNTVIRVCFVRADFGDENLNLEMWMARTADLRQTSPQDPLPPA